MVNQVILLAGGKGTRMRELTETIPKPMVEIGGIPVLTHLMNIFKNFQEFSFLVATGYKSNLIEEYYKSTDQVNTFDTGEETNTGGRVFKIKDSICPDIASCRMVFTTSFLLANFVFKAALIRGFIFFGPCKVESVLASFFIFAKT